MLIELVYRKIPINAMGRWVIKRRPDRPGKRMGQTLLLDDNDDASNPRIPCFENPWIFSVFMSYLHPPIFEPCIDVKRLNL